MTGALAACSAAAHGPTVRRGNEADAEAITDAETSSTGTEGTAATSGSDATNIISGPADPIALTVAAVDALATSATIVAANTGEISATGPDDSTFTSTFTRTVPNDALSVDTTITMTPLATVTGLLWGDARAIGVQLAPEGLSLLNFVMLTVTPATHRPEIEPVHAKPRPDRRVTTHCDAGVRRCRRPRS